MRIFIDMDGTLAKWGTIESNEELYRKDYYKNLEPNYDILTDVKRLICDNKNVYILSHYLTDSDYAKADKEQWLEKYLPELDKSKRIFIPYGASKAAFVDKNYGAITSTDYLVDDFTQNLIEWKLYGGTGIKYINGINHTRKTWKGLRAHEENAGNKQTNIRSHLCTRLTDILLAEKLKDVNIELISVRKDDATPETQHIVWANGTPYTIRTKDDETMNEIYSRIVMACANNLHRKYYSLTSTFEEMNYPTIRNCRDFKLLKEKLDRKTLDNIEYSAYVYESKVDEYENENNTYNPMYVEDAVEYINDNCSFISNTRYVDKLYVQWYEGIVDTQQLIENCTERKSE